MDIDVSERNKMAHSVSREQDMGGVVRKEFVLSTRASSAYYDGMMGYIAW